MKKTIIYLDVLLLLNLFINFLIINATKRLLQQNSSSFRLLLSSLLGSIYSLVILLPAFSAISLCFQKLFLSFFMVWIAFGKQTWRRFLSGWVLFLFVSFLFGGFCYAIWYFITPTGMILQNGIAYLPISIFALAGITIIVYLILWLMGHFLQRNIPLQQKIPIEIVLNSQILRLQAWVDTGQKVLDVLTGLPVVICEYEALLPLLPADMSRFLETLHPGEMKQWQKRIHMIPLHTVSGKSVIPAFRPDHFYILDRNGQKQERTVLIGTVKEKLSDGEVTALINDALL